MRTISAMSLAGAFSIWAASALAQNSEVQCRPSGVPSRGALYCTNDRGQSWYADANGAPTQSQQRAPMVYGDPGGAALAGQRAASQDAAALQQMQQQQSRQAATQQFSDPKFKADGAQCGHSATALYSDEASRAAFYDTCMARLGWKKPGSER